MLISHSRPPDLHETRSLLQKQHADLLDQLIRNQNTRRVGFTFTFVWNSVQVG